MKLNDLLAEWITANDRTRGKEISITGLALDSRKVVEGNLFVALSGTKEHGLNYAQQALANGAIAIIYDTNNAAQFPLAQTDASQSFFAIKDLNKLIGFIASRFYNNPSQAMNVIGITGTNGKTSCSQFLSQLLPQCGIIGTLGWGTFGQLEKTTNTTPDAIALQSILADMKKQGKQAIAMEVSSHGIDQGRINGITFKGAVVTNISRDHLDYHGNMETYLQTKLQLLKKTGLSFVVVNLDNAYQNEVINAVPKDIPIWGFSCSNNNIITGETVNGSILGYHSTGIKIEINWRKQSRSVIVPLYGDFNIENILTVTTILMAMGKDFSESIEKLAYIKPVKGRMESFGGSNSLPLVFVDYAHTPDALNRVLSSVRKHCNKNLWVVFGCGGNRDIGKRPLMREAAEYWADHIIITDDNPRFENGLTIINDILAGCKSTNIEIIQNRQEAIMDVIARATEQDCIVIAGKGHENYQEINGQYIPFHDQLVVIEALKNRGFNNANVA